VKEGAGIAVGHELVDGAAELSGATAVLHAVGVAGLRSGVGA
jgi:hypothetical protein